MKNDKKTGLGRGLDSLFGDPVIEHEGTTSSLPILKVQPGLNQPRKSFDEESISTLADSLRQHGMIQPITVRLLESGYYQIIAGERRWRAAKEAEMNEVPVVIIEADDRKVMEIGLIENLQREDLNPVEEAKGYDILMKEYHLTQDAVAERMGKSRPAVANALRLLSLPESILEKLITGEISAGHGKALLSAPSEDIMLEVASLVVEHDYSVRRTEEVIRNLKKTNEIAQEEKAETVEDQIYIFVREAEDNLTRNLGRRVTIQHKGAKGKLVLEYTDTQDLTDLVEGLDKLQEANYG